MTEIRFPVVVVVERNPLVNRWVTEQWRIAGVEPATAEADRDPTAVARSERSDVTVWRVPGFSVELHRSEATGYYLNITAPDPKIFVMCRLAEPEDTDPSAPRLCPKLVTVSYDEAARLLDGGEQVDAAPLPPEILEWMRPFVAAHYKPEKKRKVRRNELYERDDRTADVPPDSPNR